MLVCFFFNPKTAYEMRISDWSSGVCSSDLRLGDGRLEFALAPRTDGKQRMFENGHDAGLLVHAVEEILVGLRILDLVEQEFHRVDRAHLHEAARWEERRVGKECVSACRSRG